MSEASKFAYELELFKECLRLPLRPETVRAVHKSRATAWVASGLSKIAGESGRRMLQNWAGVPGHLFTPLDFCGSDHTGYLPILVSYHGRNLDIQSVARSVTEASHKRALLLSGYERTPVREQLEQGGVEVHLLSMPAHQEDRRFVAVLATWGITALGLRLAQAAAPPSAEGELTDKLIERAYRQAERDGAAAADHLLSAPGWASRKWIVLGGGATTPALLAWEAMCAEGALTSVVISDIKDYTHGRYLAAMREEHVGFVVLADGANARLGRIINERFSQLFPVVEIKSRGGELFDLCAHVFAVAFVASRLAEALGHSIASPPKPAILNNWRNWGKI